MGGEEVKERSRSCRLGKVTFKVGEDCRCRGVALCVGCV